MEEDKPYDVVIVGSGEVSIREGEVSISLDSPIGQAIRGKAAGETGKMRLNTTKKDVKVLAIK